jgi:hypothetical protein
MSLALQVLEIDARLNDRHDRICRACRTDIDSANCLDDKIVETV